MGEKPSFGGRFTLELMPVLMLIGAVMSLGSGLGLPVILLLIIVHIGFFTWIWRLKKHSVSVSDLRFLFVPGLIWLIAVMSGGYHAFPSFYDQAEHLMISNKILERCASAKCEFLFRPELIPGIAAVELAWTGDIYRIYFTPLLLLYSTGWAIQHLAEQYCSPKYAFTAPMIFLLMPIVIIHGRTMLLDVGVAGMIISAMIFYKNLEKKDYFYTILFGVIIACIGMTKYAYLYMGPWIIILLYIRKNNSLIKPFTVGWGGVIGIYLLKSFIHKDSMFSPLNNQIQGTIISLKSTKGEIGTYDFMTFLSEYIAQWSISLLCCAILGTILLIRTKPDFIRDTWYLVFPAIILHGMILDFGWIRYSTPWLALACVGIPIFLSSELFSFQVKNRNINPLFITGLIVILLSVQQISSVLIEEKEIVKTRTTVWWSIADIYVDAGQNVDENAIFTTGTSDWNLELYSSITSYQYNNSQDPVYNSIMDFEASHVFTQSRGWRYDVDVNWSYLYGSPIEPFEYYWSGSTEGYLWGVNNSRMVTHDWWVNQTVILTGGGEMFADFMYLERNTTYEIPENTTISKIIRIDNNSNISSAYQSLIGSWSSAEILCHSPITCTDLERNDYLYDRWLVWIVKN